MCRWPGWPPAAARCRHGSRLRSPWWVSCWPGGSRATRSAGPSGRGGLLRAHRGRQLLHGGRPGGAATAARCGSRSATATCWSWAAAANTPGSTPSRRGPRWSGCGSRAVPAPRRPLSGVRRRNGGRVTGRRAGGRERPGPQRTRVLGEDLSPCAGNHLAWSDGKMWLRARCGQSMKYLVHGSVGGDGCGQAQCPVLVVLSAGAAW